MALSEFGQSVCIDGFMDNAPDCCTICGAVAGFESLAKHSVVMYMMIGFAP